MGLGAVAVLAMIIVPIMLYEAPPEPPPGTVSDAPATPMNPQVIFQALGIGVFLLIIGFVYVGEIAGGYIALMLMNQLPSQDFLDNCFSLAIILFMVGLASFVPIVGPIAGLFIVAKVYDLGCGGLLFFAFMTTVGSAISLMILMGGLALFMPA